MAKISTIVKLWLNIVAYLKQGPYFSHQGEIKFKPELRVRNKDYGWMKVNHFVVEKR